MEDISLNIQSIKIRIKKACDKVNRNYDEIILLAASKEIPPDMIETAIKSGISTFGENKVQEAGSKIPQLKEKYPDVKWHMIGHLQRNKVRRCLEIFDIIESVDSFRLAEEINKAAKEINRNVEVFVEVNVSGETQKYGVALSEVGSLLNQINGLERVAVKGLMTVPPYFEDPEKARPYFRKLKQTADKLSIYNVSMGMTDDFEVAVEEGSNIVRIGRAIFGNRRKYREVL